MVAPNFYKFQRLFATVKCGFHLVAIRRAENDWNVRKKVWRKHLERKQVSIVLQGWAMVSSKVAKAMWISLPLLILAKCSNYGFIAACTELQFSILRSLFSLLSYDLDIDHNSFGRQLEICHHRVRREFPTNIFFFSRCVINDASLEKLREKYSPTRALVIRICKLTPVVELLLTFI